MNGIVAAGSAPTAQAGASMYTQGGNAVDAAVAAAFASMVAEASISSFGGGGFALLHDGTQEPQLYDFFCAMPGIGAVDFEAQRQALDFVEVPIRFADTPSTYTIGRGSTAVPGNPAGLAQLLRDAGRLPLSAVLEPAIGLAQEGLAVPEGQGNVMRSIERVLTHTPESAALFAPQGTLLQEGERYHNPAFAETLRHFAQRGDESVYRGDIAQAIVQDQGQNGGLITLDDLARYRVQVRRPLQLRYRGHRFYTNPPPSPGGILIAYALHLLEQADLSGMRHGSAEHVALLAEIMQQANLARHRDNLVQHVDTWQEYLARDFSADWDAVQARLAGDAAADVPHRASGSPNTTHISAIDAHGLAVSITTTPGATGGYVVGATGILTNNILGERDLNPQGFHRATPGTRLQSMMSPTVVDTAGGRRLVLGSAGSSRIRSAILQVISNLVDWDHDLYSAVNEARVHYENDALDLEWGYREEAAVALEQRGYNVRRWSVMNLYFGGAHVALQDLDGSLQGAGDLRRGGVAVVV